jgi:hypothetical protein
MWVERLVNFILENFQHFTCNFTCTCSWATCTVTCTPTCKIQPLFFKRTTFQLGNLIHWRLEVTNTIFQSLPESIMVGWSRSVAPSKESWNFALFIIYPRRLPDTNFRPEHRISMHRLIIIFWLTENWDYLYYRKVICWRNQGIYFRNFRFQKCIYPIRQF